MRVLITGASGMLGAYLVQKWQDVYEVYATGRSDFIGNPSKNFIAFDLKSNSFDSIIDWAKPEVIIHCAAITNVDYCEENTELCMEVNAESVNKFLVSGVNSRMIFISSESVFPDGINMASEKDEIAPENVYGRSKDAGEKYIQDSGDPHLAIRTTIVGRNINPQKKSFVEWIIYSLKDGKEITLFKDAIFTPITIWHLADELEWILANHSISGVVHINGRESISKYEFGFRVCEQLGFDTNLIQKGSINNMVFKANRSHNQTMDSSYYQLYTKRSLPSMEDTIKSITNHFT